MPVRWWWQHGMKLPLIQEMLRAIPGFPGHRAAGASNNMVVKIVVRGKDVMVMNNCKAVTLPLDATTFDGQELQWILDALKEDITNLPEEDPEGTGGPRQQGRASKEPQSWMA